MCNECIILQFSSLSSACTLLSLHSLHYLSRKCCGMFLTKYNTNERSSRQLGGTILFSRRRATMGPPPQAAPTQSNEKNVKGAGKKLCHFSIFAFFFRKTRAKLLIRTNWLCQSQTLPGVVKRCGVPNTARWNTDEEPELQRKRLTLSDWYGPGMIISAD